MTDPNGKTTQYRFTGAVLFDYTGGSYHAGSMLIERVFDINGFGLLQFNAILERDEPLMMGVLFVSATLLLIGNVISDLCVALVDPRVSFK